VISYSDDEKMEYVSASSKVAEQYIMEHAEVSESRAQAWIKKYRACIGKQKTFRAMVNHKKGLKAEKCKFKDLEKRFEICQQLLLDGRSNDRKKRRELAQTAVSRYGHSVARACEVLNISQGYYRSSKVDLLESEKV
jgi:hypothetical protein